MRFLFFRFLWWHSLHNLLVVCCYFAPLLSFDENGCSRNLPECGVCKDSSTGLTECWDTGMGTARIPDFSGTILLPGTIVSVRSSPPGWHIQRDRKQIWNVFPCPQLWASCPMQQEHPLQQEEAGCRRNHRPKGFATQPQFALWLSYDSGTPSSFWPLTTFHKSPVCITVRFQRGKFIRDWLGKGRALLWQISLCSVWYLALTSHFGANEASLGLICWFCCLSLYPNDSQFIFSRGGAEVSSVFCPLPFKSILVFAGETSRDEEILKSLPVSCHCRKKGAVIAYDLPQDKK